MGQTNSSSEDIIEDDDDDGTPSADNCGNRSNYRSTLDDVSDDDNEDEEMNPLVLNELTFSSGKSCTCSMFGLLVRLLF